MRVKPVGTKQKDVTRYDLTKPRRWLDLGGNADTSRQIVRIRGWPHFPVVEPVLVKGVIARQLRQSPIPKQIHATVANVEQEDLICVGVGTPNADDRSSHRHPPRSKAGLVFSADGAVCRRYGCDDGPVSLPEVAWAAGGKGISNNLDRQSGRHFAPLMATHAVSDKSQIHVWNDKNAIFIGQARALM